MSRYPSSGASGHSRSSKASAPDLRTVPRDSIASHVSVGSTVTDVSTTSSWVDVDYPTAPDVAAPVPPDCPARDPTRKTWLGRLTSKEPKRLSMTYADDDGHDMTLKLLDRLTIVSEVTNINYEDLQTPTDAGPAGTISDTGVQRRSAVSNLELSVSRATTPTGSRPPSSLHASSTGPDDFPRRSASTSAHSYRDLEAPIESQGTAIIRSARDSTASSMSTASSRSFASSGSRVSATSTAPTSRPSSVASSAKAATYTGASARHSLADKATATPGQGTVVVNLKHLDNGSVASYGAASVSERRRSSATANSSAADEPPVCGSVASAAGSAARSGHSKFVSPVHSVTRHGNDAATLSELAIKPSSPAFVAPQPDAPAEMPRKSASRHHSSDPKAPVTSARTKEAPRAATTNVPPHPADLTNATTPSWCKALGTPKPVQVVNVTEVYPAGQGIIRPTKQPSTSARGSSSPSSGRLADLSNSLPDTHSDHGRSSAHTKARHLGSPVSPSKHAPGRTYPISKDQCATVTVSGPLGACRSLQAGYEELDRPAVVSIAVEPYSVRKHVMNKDDIVWLICWDVGTCGTGRRVLRVRCEDGAPVYFGPRTHDAHDALPFVGGGRQVHIADMDTYPVGTLDLVQRRRLEEVAGHVGDVDGYTSFEWICRVLKTAYRPPKGRAILDREAVMAALNSISNSIHGDL
ncbi:hypothetical protein PsYK624_166130 [Phanerochaete sordida]|uniref:Uncharacterized protein n=1 Tax=Phanerochaete sordida TaxID=48140 RepID=A0A9P3GRT4_9APHY|nr:hypothetical protein PsYK624_166130 [Phanerochaete sordida]